MIVNIFDAVIFFSILSCALTAGLLFGFAVVVMPGIGKLPDRDFLQAFKLIDGIIQNRQPVFMFVWIGSIVSVVLSLVLGTMKLSGPEQYLLWFASGLYLLAVQGPTVRFNIPLNNAVQNLDLKLLSERELVEFRTQFEGPWNRWNRFRTCNAVVSVIGLLVLQFLLV